MLYGQKSGISGRKLKVSEAVTPPIELVERNRYVHIASNHLKIAALFQSIKNKRGLRVSMSEKIKHIKFLDIDGVWISSFPQQLLSARSCASRDIVTEATPKRTNLIGTF